MFQIKIARLQILSDFQSLNLIRHGNVQHGTFIIINAPLHFYIYHCSYQRMSLETMEKLGAFASYLKQGNELRNVHNENFKVSKQRREGSDNDSIEYEVKLEYGHCNFSH